MPKRTKIRKIGRNVPSNRLLKLKNADKRNHETWKSTGTKNIACFPHPFKMCILGGVNLGKSTLAKNILLQNQKSHRRKFKQVYVIHLDPTTREYDDIQPTQIIPADDMPTREFWYGNKDKSLIIIDDIELAKCSKEMERAFASLFRYISSHHNYSIIFCHQSFFDLPPIIKKCSSIFILFKPDDLDSQGTIGRRLGFKKLDILELFHKCKNKRDTLCIDKTEDSPAEVRINLFTPVVKKCKLEEYLAKRNLDHDLS
jgi:hypothetical protein